MLEDSTAPYENMSASLLAEQPPTLPDAPELSTKAWDRTYSHLESRLNALRTWRWSWQVHWLKIAEYFMPRRSIWTWNVNANLMNRGNPLNEQIVDSTATQAVNTCASGLWTGLTSPSRPWVKLGLGLPWVTLDADGKEWLEDSEQRLYTVLGQSNFYTQMAQAFVDVVLFGTAPPIIYEDQEDVIRLYLPCAGEYFLGAGARLAVDTLYREFTLTVLQIVEQFKLENCPQEVRELWRMGGGSLENEFVVAHAIEPNFDLSDDASGKIQVVPGSFTYRELYWLKGNKTGAPLSKRGFHGRPFMAFHWSRVSNDAYGRSPCMDALGDVRQIQMETRRKAEAIEKMVKPPMIADVDMKNEPSSILPGHITYVNTAGGKRGFEPAYQINPAVLAPLVEDIKMVSARVEHTLFVDIFMAISRMEGVQPRNELELTKRDLERLQSLGPFIQLFENEMNNGIERILDIMQRRGMLKQMPDSLKGVPLKLSYITIMSQAQKGAESVAMKDFFGTMGALSSAAKAAAIPDPLRIVDLETAAREYAVLNNVPNKILFTADEVQQHDAARAKAQQQMQQPAQAMAAVTAAKTLSDTQLPGGNTALGAIVGPGR